MKNNVQRICLTPTRNEAWIISRFLAAAGQWATRLIVVDQRSDDGTLQVVQSTPGVEVIINDSPVYDEAYRQKLLIDQARRIPGKRVLIALDADEALSANCFNSAEWDKINQAPAGTVLRFRWVNVLPGFKQAWIPPNPIACGYVDDGSDHEGSRIHSRRIPWPQNAPVLDLDEIVVLHFQYVASDRVTSKHRWYQAWEHLTHPQKSALEIFRGYHHMDGSWAPNEMFPFRPEWLEGYERLNVIFRNLESEKITWWDRELLQMLIKHGPATFRRFSIWDKDWNALANQIYGGAPDLSDPRTLLEKMSHNLLRATQKYRGNWCVRGFERLLRTCGW